jgi:hypothetical protein
MNYEQYCWQKKKLKKYGLSVEDYDTIQEAQGGVCAICKVRPQNSKHWHVDHCHRTGKVRGLLCGDCNRGLGSFKDSVISLQRAIGYLE